VAVDAADAVAAVQPWAVDVATGVEASPGVKDPAKVEAFMAAAGESAGAGSLASSPGGEHRGELAGRYGRGFRALTDRPEDTILLVAHSLPLAYLRDAAAGTAPRSRMDMVDYAQVLRLEVTDVERAIGVLGDWASAPAF